MGFVSGGLYFLEEPGEIMMPATTCGRVYYRRGLVCLTVR